VIVHKHFVVEAQKSLVLADSATVQLLQNCSVKWLARLVRKYRFSASLRANIKHDRKIAAGSHLDGLDKHGRARSARAHAQFELRRIFHSFEPFFFPVSRRFRRCGHKPQCDFKHNIAAYRDCYADHDQCPQMSVEFDVERFKGGVDQAGQHQHEQGIQQLPSNWSHLLLPHLKMPTASLRDWDEIVFADTLQNQESSRGLTAVGYKMRALRPNRIGFAWREAHLLLGVAQEDPEESLQNVKSVLDVRVAVPGYLLRGADRVLGDPKPRTRGVIHLSLYVKEMAWVLYGFHTILRYS
jgi:hypothetical protein